MLKIISWNVRGLERPEKKRAVHKLIRGERPALMSIQETKMDSIDATLLRKIGGGAYLNNIESVEAVASAGGLISMWNDAVFWVSQVISHQWYLVLVGKFILEDLECVICNIYAPNGDAERARFWGQLISLKEQLQIPWCIARDCNVVRFPHERKGGQFAVGPSRDFEDFIQKGEFLDINLCGRAFTWSNNREAVSMARLDRFLIPVEWVQCFPDIKQWGLNLSLLDHCPIALGSERVNWGPIPFKFYNN